MNSYLSFFLHHFDITHMYVINLPFGDLLLLYTPAHFYPNNKKTSLPKKSITPIRKRLKMRLNLVRDCPLRYGIRSKAQ